MISFEVIGTPVPKGSMRGFVVGKRAVVTHNSKKTKPWQQQIAQLAAANSLDLLIEGPVCVRLIFRVPRPKTVPKVRNGLPAAKPDIDKLARPVLDACTGTIWKDDSQVVSLRASKVYATDEVPPGVLVEVVEQ